MPPIQPISDIELLALIREGDTAAFRILYDRHWKALYIRACKSVNEDEAKDIVQDVMVSLWNRRHEISVAKGDEILRYLFTAVKYRLISHYAYTKAKIKKELLFEFAETITPDTVLENKELRMLLDSAIEEMPGRMKLIFKMSREENISLSNIAIELKISDQTVKNTVSEALRRLRSFLSANRRNGY
ncbi:RNA polymerase sigma factor (sigma-70 family) [Pedobacter sp. UYP24]